MPHSLAINMPYFAKPATIQDMKQNNNSKAEETQGYDAIVSLILFKFT